MNRSPSNAINEGDITQPQKEKLITSISYILSTPSTANAYYDNIISLLNEMNISFSSYLKMCIALLSRHSKHINDLQLISGYLVLMKNFSKIFAEFDESQLSKQILTISKHLGYEKIEQNTVLMRLGDKGIKAYIMLSGNVDVIIKTAKKMTITSKSYLYYIANIIRYKEYGILNAVINDNFITYPIEIINDITDEPASLYTLNTKNQSMVHSDQLKRYKASTLLEMLPNENCDDSSTNGTKKKDSLNNVTTADYVNRINLCLSVSQNEHHYNEYSPDDLGPIELIIYSYLKVASLTTGALFGEIALSNPDALRTATILATSECHFGTLNKTSYNESLKKCKEKIYRSTLSFIYSNKLFSNIKLGILGRKYFNYFSAKKITKGEYLYNEGTKVNSLYLLREGEYEISIRASLRELARIIKMCYSKIRNATAKINSIEKSERAVESEIKENLKLSKVYNDKQIIKVSCINAPDIIGLSDIVDKEGNAMFSIECKSVKGDVLELSNVFYTEMKLKEYSIEPNEKVLEEKKYKIMIERLNSIRNSKLITYSHFMRNTINVERMIETEKQKSRAMKRKISAKKTVINARDVKLTKDKEKNRGRTVSKPSTRNVFVPPKKKNTTIEVPIYSNKKKNVINKSIESKNSFNPYSFSEETIKYINTMNNYDSHPFFYRMERSSNRTITSFETSKPSKSLYLNDLALEKLEPKRRILLLNTLSEPYTERKKLKISLQKKKISFISNSVLPIHEVPKTDRSVKRARTEAIETHERSNKVESCQYLQYTLSKIKNQFN